VLTSTVARLLVASAQTCHHDDYLYTPGRKMDIKRLLDFDFDTETLGKLRIGPLETSHHNLRAEINSPAFNSTTFAMRIFREVAEKPIASDGAQMAYRELTEEEVGDITIAELDEFCDAFCRSRLSTVPQKSPEPEMGRTRLVQAFLDEEMVIAARDDRRAEQIKNFEASTLASLRQNEGIADRLQLSSAALRLPPILPHPMSRTNEVLGEVRAQIEQMRPVFADCADLIRSMNSTALQMQSDSISSSNRSDKMANRSLMVANISIGISIVALIISSAFSLVTLLDSRESGIASDKQSKALASELHAVAAVNSQLKTALDLAAAEAAKQRLENISVSIPSVEAARQPVPKK